ncbi:MAG: HU family DNA-binding protein [Solirubrobacteraceae bacterium]
MVGELPRRGTKGVPSVGQGSIRTSNRSNELEESVPLTQTQLIAAVADRAELSKADVKRALGALDEVVMEELGNAQKVRIGGLVQLTVRVKPAQKKRKGRNPATGEEIDIAAKPASVDVRARPLAKAKTALPSVQKARRRLAAG